MNMTAVLFKLFLIDSKLIFYSGHQHEAHFALKMDDFSIRDNLDYAYRKCVRYSLSAMDCCIVSS
jgi:hypothetical protein